jgi:hypothetical protein
VGQGPVGPVVVVDGGERLEQGLQLDQGAGLDGLGGEPFLEGLLEAFHLAAGGGVVGAGVLLDHAEASQFGLQPVAAALAAGQAGGEDHPVVGEGGRRGPIAVDGAAECRQDDRAGDPGMGGDRQPIAGAVVQPAQDLGVGSGGAVGPGEAVVGEVGLPGLVGQGGREPQVGRLGPLLGGWGDQPGAGQVAADGGRRDGGAVVVGQVPGDGVRPGVQARGGELATQFGDQRDGGRWDGGRAGVGRRERGSNAASPLAW